MSLTYTYVNGNLADADEVNTNENFLLRLATASFKAAVISNTSTNQKGCTIDEPTAAATSVQHGALLIHKCFGNDADYIIDTLAHENMVTTSTNLTYDDFGDVYVNTSGNAAFVSNTFTTNATINSGVGYFNYQIYELVFNGTSTTNWTGTISTAGTPAYLNVSGANNAYYTGKNFYELSGYIILTCYVTGGNGFGIVFTDDGTHNVTIAGSGITGVDTPSMLNGYFTIFIKLHGTADTFDSYVNGVLFIKGGDLSTLVDYWRIKLDGAAAGNIYVRTCLYQKSSPTTTVALTMSADSGSNDESITNGEYHAFTNTGTGLIMKATTTIAANEAVAFWGWGFMRTS